MVFKMRYNNKIRYNQKTNSWYKIKKNLRKCKYKILRQFNGIFNFISGLLIKVIFVSIVIGCIGIYDWTEENYIFKDTYETYPYDHGAQLIGADGHKITLVNHKNATDVTYNEVITFIKNDKTDQNPYTSTYQCGDFAEDVHNNAELNNIKCGYVLVDRINHACNVFNTTDKGLIFIDCTNSNYGGSCDSIVKIENGHQYIPKPIKNNGWNYEPMGIVTDYSICW